MTLPVSITINGRRYDRDVEPRLLLIHFIRDLGGLTGMSSQLERLRAAGIEVRVETDADPDPYAATGALMVHPDNLERAREVLGIAI